MRSFTGIGPWPSPSSSMKPSALVRPVGDRRDRLALELLRLAVDLVARLDVGLVAEAVEDRLEPRLACAARGDLRVHVADERVAEAAVPAQQVDDVLARLAAVVDPRRRPAHPLLVDLARVHRPAGVLAADVEPVRARRGEADEPVVPVDRAEDGRIVQVRARSCTSRSCRRRRRAGRRPSRTSRRRASRRSRGCRGRAAGRATGRARRRARRGWRPSSPCPRR